MKMKLLFYIPGLVDGGAERVMASIADWFALQGHDVRFVVDFKQGKNSPSLNSSVQRLQLSGKHLASIRQLAALLVRDPPDIAVSAIASANFKLTAASLLARIRSPFNRSKTHLVLTYHGFEEYKSGKLSWLGYKFLPLMSLNASCIIAVSNSLKETLAKRWKARRDKLACIYNPVLIPPMPEGFDPDNLEGRDNLILSVGRLVPGKRFDLLIEGFAQLKDPSARLVILGEGDERPRLEALIDRLDLARQVELPGYVNDTGAYYARAKCFALTSSSESFGLVLVEALAFGLPVVATDCGGPREVLDEGRYGALLDNNAAPHELAEALHAALLKPGVPGPRIKRAKSFELHSSINQYVELFAKLLGVKP